jgi:sirohydrochlorin ferrochelatase
MLGLILIDHGSRRAEANEQLLDMAARVQRLRPHDVVTIAHMEIATPSLSDAVAEVVARGAAEIIILPYFLSSGRHVTHDIPDLAKAACAVFPTVTYRIGQALGPHDQLAALLLERGGIAL